METDSIRTDKKRKPNPSGENPKTVEELYLQYISYEDTLLSKAEMIRDISFLIGKNFKPLKRKDTIDLKKKSEEEVLAIASYLVGQYDKKNEIPYVMFKANKAKEAQERKAKEAQGKKDKRKPFGVPKRWKIPNSHNPTSKDPPGLGPGRARSKPGRKQKGKFLFTACSRLGGLLGCGRLR